MFRSPQNAEQTELFDAEIAVPASSDSLTAEFAADVDKPSLIVRALGALYRAAQWLFGLASLIVILAVLATLPILQLLSLGYLLEASGRVARSGKFRHGFIGISQAGRLGSLVAGTWLSLLPVRYVSGLWYAASLIDPTSASTQATRVILVIVTVLTVGHILASWYCGGQLRHFLWPLIAPFQAGLWLLRVTISKPRIRPLFDWTIGLISRRFVRDICDFKPWSDWFVPAKVWRDFKRGGAYSSARDAVWDYVVGLRLHYFFWLGLRGFIGAFVWLVIPVALLVGATTAEQQGGAVLAGLLGSLLMTAVVLHLPILQTRFAAENRLAVMFNVSAVYRAYWHAPIVWWAALAATTLFALPLYLLKIELTQAELTWIPSVVFVLFIFPARLICGRALARADVKYERRDLRRHTWYGRLGAGCSRIVAGLGALPVALLYVLVLFISRYTNWNGVWSLFEQHAFLVPVPFFNV